jgi:hypothetical protein
MPEETGLEFMKFVRNIAKKNNGCADFRTHKQQAGKSPACKPLAC